MLEARKLGKYAMLEFDRVRIDGFYYKLEDFEDNSKVKSSTTEQHVTGSSPTRLNLQARQSEEASVSHYCDSNCVSKTDILRNKNVNEQQNFKPNQQKLDSSVTEKQIKHWEEKLDKGLSSVSIRTLLTVLNYRTSNDPLYARFEVNFLL